jgi:hypothetical protein
LSAAPGAAALPDRKVGSAVVRRRSSRECVQSDGLRSPRPVLIRVGGNRSLARPWTGRVARTLITAVAAVVVALVAGKVPARYAPFAVLAAPLVVLLLVLVRRVDPKWFLAALVFSTCLGWWQVSTSAGRVNVRLTDLPYVLLLGSLLFVSGRAIAQRVDVGQRLLAALLLVFGLSLIPFLVLHPQEFFSPFVSWLRLVETFSVVWLLPYVVKRPSDARFVMGVVAGACATELGKALVDAVVSGQLSGRLQGGNGPDTEGLLAAILIVTVIYGMVPRWPLGRTVLLGLGVVSLLLSKSVASVVAVGLVLALAPPPRRTARRRSSGLLRPMQLIIVVAALAITVVGVRSENLPGTSNFASSSTMQRVIYGADGVDIFEHHPILGVGFSRSELANVIGDPSVVSEVQRWFPNTPPQLFHTELDCRLTGQLTSAGPTSGCFLGTVHNAYIEVGAEAGVIGLVTLLVAAVGIRRRIRKVRAQTTDPAIQAVLRWATLVMVVVLIWWNDNPLFGAHPETLLFALALGMLAVPWGSLPAAPQPTLGEHQPVGSRAG